MGHADPARIIRGPPLPAKTMDPGLKQRLVGAAVLVALAVIFLPLLVKGPAPDSGVADLPLGMPAAPGRDYATRDLPLAAPGAESPTALGGDRIATVDTAGAGSPVVTAPLGDGGAAAQAPLPGPADVADRLPPTSAGGDYAVTFGAYASSDGAGTVVARLRAAGLPGYREAATVGGKPAWRVRIGPYATRADAEAVRIVASSVRGDVDARVVALDAAKPTASVSPAPAPAPDAAAATPKATTTAATTPPAATAPAPPVPAPRPTVAADIGFAVQVGAFSKPADASALRDRIRAAGFNAFTEAVDTDKGPLTRVKAGPVIDRATADQLKADLRSKLGLDGIVRSHP